MTTTVRHFCIDVSGALRNMEFPDHYWGVFKNDDGTDMHPVTARRMLLEAQAKGYKVLPCGQCDNFDYSGGGCQGHPCEDSEPDEVPHDR